MSKKSKASIDSMLTSSVEARNTRSGAVILKTGARYHTLLSTTGEKTTLGEYYESKTGQELPVGGFAPRQSPYREGDTEYIKMRNGEHKVTRRYSIVDKDFKFTNLGKSFYSKIKRSYVVQLPVTVKGKRKNGTYYNIKSTLPIAKLGMDRIEMPLSLTAAQRTAKIKDIVKRRLDLDEPLYEASQEEWKYDTSSETAWIINEETVGRDPDSGEMVVALDRRTGVAPYSLSQIPYPEDLCEEALIDCNDMMCVPRQIAAIVSLDFGRVCEELLEIERILYGKEEMAQKGLYCTHGNRICKRPKAGCFYFTQWAGIGIDYWRESTSCRSFA